MSDSPTARDYAARHSLAQKPLDRQSTFNVINIGRLGIAVVRDRRLRQSALAIAVLSGLLLYGAGEHMTTVPLSALADDLDTRYDAVYKAVRRLATYGYVECSRMQTGTRRLMLRVVWPGFSDVPLEPKPIKRGTRETRGERG